MIKKWICVDDGDKYGDCGEVTWKLDRKHDSGSFGTKAYIIPLNQRVYKNTTIWPYSHLDLVEYSHNDTATTISSSVSVDIGNSKCCGGRTNQRKQVEDRVKRRTRSSPGQYNNGKKVIQLNPRGQGRPGEHHRVKTDTGRGLADLMPKIDLSGTAEKYGQYRRITNNMSSIAQARPEPHFDQLHRELNYSIQGPRKLWVNNIPTPPVTNTYVSPERYLNVSATPLGLVDNKRVTKKRTDMKQHTRTLSAPMTANIKTVVPARQFMHVSTHGVDELHRHKRTCTTAGRLVETGDTLVKKASKRGKSKSSRGIKEQQERKVAKNRIEGQPRSVTDTKECLPVTSTRRRVSHRAAYRPIVAGIQAENSLRNASTRKSPVPLQRHAGYIDKQQTHRRKSRDLYLPHIFVNGKAVRPLESPIRRSLSIPTTPSHKSNKDVYPLKGSPMPLKYQNLDNWRQCDYINLKQPQNQHIGNGRGRHRRTATVAAEINGRNGPITKRNISKDTATIMGSVYSRVNSEHNNQSVLMPCNTDVLKNKYSDFFIE